MLFQKILVDFISRIFDDWHLFFITSTLFLGSFTGSNLICTVSKDDEDEEEGESEDTLPNIDLLIKQDDPKPNVSPKGRSASDGEDAHIINSLDSNWHFLISVFVIVVFRRHSVDGDSTDDEQVERSGTDDGRCSELSWAFTEIGARFQNSKKDLWRTGTQGHEGQVGYSGVPEKNLPLSLVSFTVNNGDDDLFGCDFFNCLHEDFCDNRNTEEEVDQGQAVEDGEHTIVECGHTRDQKNTLADFNILTEVDNSSSRELFYLHSEPFFSLPADLGLFFIGVSCDEVRQDSEAEEDGSNEATRPLGPAKLPRR